ncbi:MAG: hypothetical protein ACR2IF_14505 [Terriglobales bacterium]
MAEKTAQQGTGLSKNQRGVAKDTTTCCTGQPDEHMPVAVGVSVMCSEKMRVNRISYAGFGKYINAEDAEKQRDAVLGEYLNVTSSLPKRHRK